MATDTEDRLTDSEIGALASKMEDWSRGLSARERIFMAEVLIHAADSAPADVQGYAASPLVANTVSTLGNQGQGAEFVFAADQIEPLLQSISRLLIT